MSDQSQAAAAEPKAVDPAVIQPGAGADPAKAAPAAAPEAKGVEPAGTLATGGEKKEADLGTGELQKLRETLSGGDEDFMKELGRYKSVESLTKAMREARIAARNTGKAASTVPTLKEGANDAEIAAYREAYGIPADAKEYPGDFRADFKPTDGDKQLLGDFKAAMHSKNVPPQAAAAALDWYQDFATIQQQQRDGLMAKRETETMAALKAEWGSDYKPNIAAANHIMNQTIGPEGAEELLGVRLEDGTRLQDNKNFVKMMAQLGSDYFGGTAIIKGDIETTGKSVQDQINEGLKMLNGTPAQQAEYRTPAYQEKMAKLYAQKEKLDKRA